MIRAYFEPESVAAGEVARLRISAAVDAVHVAIYRLGGQSPAIAVLGPLPTQLYPGGECSRPWDWPATAIGTDAAWRSGVYLAYLHPCVSSDHRTCVPSQRPPVDGRDGRALLVVRPAPGAELAPLLYKIPLSTYHAYNFTGGGSLYRGTSLEPGTGRRIVNLSRPGGGTGGDLSFPEAVDVYDPTSPREGVAHWDLPFLDWLHAAGYRADVCSDLDLDRDPGLLHGYRALVSAGHDEYWTAATRDAVERFVRRGGSAAFFSGNLCFWRVQLDGDRLICRHPPVASADCDQWWRIRPETALSGVSYRNGGGWWSGPRDAVGYTVVDAGHWVYDGTGLRDGEVFGAEQRLVGYECDAAELDLSDPDRVRPVPMPGEPPVHLLGVARLGPGWQDRPRQERASATMVVSAPGGVVFTAGTTDWPRLLATGDAVVGQITRNVLDRISLPVRRLRAPAIGRAGESVDVWVDAERTARVDWQASAGQVVGDGPRVTVLLPHAAATVTVSAVVHEGSAPTGFAAAAVQVLTAADAAQLDLLTAIRALVAATPPDPHPGEPPGPGNRQLADPEWEAVRDGLRRRLTSSEAAELATLADAVRELAAVLGALTTDEPEADADDVARGHDDVRALGPGPGSTHR